MCSEVIPLGKYENEILVFHLIRLLTIDFRLWTIYLPPGGQFILK